jgi:hypothetical protein
MPPVIDDSYFYGDDARLPVGHKMCEYGRFGVTGRAIRDGLGYVKSGLGVVAFAVGGGIAGALLSRVTGVSALAAVGLGAVAGFALLGLVVTGGTLWALTPWGRRCHWQNVFIRPYTLGGGDGCALLSHHWHAITNLRCIVHTPARNQIEMPIAEPARKEDGQKIRISPGEKLNSFILPLSDGPGRYRFIWRAELDSCRKTKTVARGRFRVKEP